MSNAYSPSILISKNEVLQPNTKRIYLIRHGHSGGTDKISTMDPSLTEKGIKQSQLLKGFFKNKQIDTIVTSELRRAKETANIIKGNRDINIRSFVGFNELHAVNNWANIPESKLTKIINSRIYKYDEAVKYGETLFNFHKRIENTWENVILPSKETNIVLVTHYEVMRVLISLIFKVKAATNIDFLVAFPHTSISEIRIVDTKKDIDLPDSMYVLQYLCNIEHLTQDLVSY